MEINKKVLNFEHTSKKFQCLPIFKKPDTKSGGNRIRQAFLDVPMVNQHEGLTAIALKGGIDPKDLKPGDFILFMNSDWTKLKLMGPNHVLVYIAAPGGQRISHLFLKALPELFNSNKPIEYDKAMRPLLEKYLSEKRQRKAKEVN